MRVDYIKVEGYPQPKERSGVGIYGNLYKKKRTREYEDKINDAMGLYLGADVYRGIIYVDLICIFSRTKELMKRYKDGRFKYGTTRLAHLVKPDHDNVRKSVLDGMQGYMDGGDCRVIGGLTMKYYGGIINDECESEKVIIRVITETNLEELHDFISDGSTMKELLSIH